MMARRRFIAGALLAPLLPFLNLEARAETAVTALPDLGPPHAFSFDRLREQARRLAAQPYQAPTIRHAEVLERIDYDIHEKIRYRPEAALWARGDGPYPVRLFHLASLFREPVKLFMVRDGVAREILYSRQLFDYDKDALFAAAELPDDMGFAGFRVMNSDPRQRDWLCFLGASYFRNTGELGQYGLSARGVAIDTGFPSPEEFPRFTHFWLEPAADPGSMLIHALLEGSSICGAYRIEVVRPKGVVMTIEAALFARQAIRRLGVAPLTSMFWFSETNNHLQVWDWRPEVHDSDGLALWTGSGERIWRPLNNPPVLQTSSFPDINPRGFGLLQRDRGFENYQDDMIFYERRPSLWVEALEPWGEGVVQLIEIPTRSEFFDNIVAYWVPKVPVPAGAALNFKYRLHWVADEPYPPVLGRVIAARLAWEDPLDARPNAPRQGVLVVDFVGGPLESLEKDVPIQLVASTTRGRLVASDAVQLSGTRRWRAFLYIELEGAEPMEIRALLKLGDRILSETCLYPCFPPRA
ncbi:MAG: glucan biosynthesis protein [Candidatus Competibacter sp.]|nr:glucan biosynthesis protein [Candidatus Competibacter sp.]